MSKKRTYTFSDSLNHPGLSIDTVDYSPKDSLEVKSLKADLSRAYYSLRTACEYLKGMNVEPETLDPIIATLRRLDIVLNRNG